MEDSILKSVKKNLGIEADDTSFDEDVLTHINSVFATLNQLGLGPTDGFEVTGEDELWSTYLDGNLNRASVRTYMYLKVRIFFDPPTTSFHLEALNKQATELEWRLNVQREDTEWTDPDPEEEV